VAQAPPELRLTQVGPWQCEMVFLLFNRGRSLLLAGVYSDAEKQLSHAFRLCDPRHTRNIQKILQYLIPVKLLLGKLPQVGWFVSAAYCIGTDKGTFRVGRGPCWHSMGSPTCMTCWLRH
jgi:hypothetical protein